MSTMANELGAYIEREIRQRGWTQRQASAVFDLPPTTLNNIIHGRHNPDLLTLRKLAEPLRVSVVRLLEIAGFVTGPSDDDEETPDPFAALTAEDRAFIDSLSAAELYELIDLARRLRRRP